MNVRIEGENFVANIDLGYLCRMCGVKDPDWRKYSTNPFIAVKTGQAKKIFRLLIRYCDEEKIKEIEEFIMNCENPKVKKAWQEVIKRWD